MKQLKHNFCARTTANTLLFLKNSLKLLFVPLNRMDKLCYSKNKLVSGLSMTSVIIYCLEMLFMSLSIIFTILINVSDSSTRVTSIMNTTAMSNTQQVPNNLFINFLSINISFAEIVLDVALFIIIVGAIALLFIGLNKINVFKPFKFILHKACYGLKSYIVNVKDTLMQKKLNK